MEIIQIIIVIFALFALSRVVIRFRKKELAQGEFIFWIIIWLGIIGVSLLPRLSFYLAEIFGVKRGTDVLVYLGIVVLFYLVFRLYVRQEKIEKEVTKVVREIARKEVKEKETKK